MVEELGVIKAAAPVVVEEESVAMEEAPVSNRVLDLVEDMAVLDLEVTVAVGAIVVVLPLVEVATEASVLETAFVVLIERTV